jgi:hypothetical protein
MPKRTARAAPPAPPPTPEEQLARAREAEAFYRQHLIETIRRDILPRLMHLVADLERSTDRFERDDERATLREVYDIPPQPEMEFAQEIQQAISDTIWNAHSERLTVFAGQALAARLQREELERSGAGKTTA